MQAASKRFKVTGTGKVLLRHPGKQHINEKKPSKRLSQLGKSHSVSVARLQHYFRAFLNAALALLVEALLACNLTAAAQDLSTGLNNLISCCLATKGSLCWSAGERQGLAWCQGQLALQEDYQV